MNLQDLPALNGVKGCPKCGAEFYVLKTPAGRVVPDGVAVEGDAEMLVPSMQYVDPTLAVKYEGVVPRAMQRWCPKCSFTWCERPRDA